MRPALWAALTAISPNSYSQGGTRCEPWFGGRTSAQPLRRLGAEVMQGDLTNLASMHRAIEGCRRNYFGMSVSAAYLEATINTAAVARHHGVEALRDPTEREATRSCTWRS